MSDEKMKILEMIEKHIITADEGIELLDAIEDNQSKVSEEEPEENNFDEKILKMKDKAKELKDKIEVDVDIDGYKAKGEAFADDFKEEMKSLGENIKKEMKFFKKDAKNLGREMSRLGRDAAVFSQGIVNDVLESVKAVDDDDFQKQYNDGDYEMDEDKKVRNYNIAQEFSIDCDGKKDILIDVISTDVNIITEERENILVKYISYSEKDEDMYKVIVEEDSKAIKLYERKEKDLNRIMNFSFSSGEKELLIRLPRKYKESLSVKTISGDLNINYLDSNSFRFSTVSGDLQADIIYSINSLIKSTSGDCRIDLFRGNIMFSSVSGDIDIKYEKLDGDFTMKSISGDAEIKLPNNSEFEVIGRTISGDMNCDFPITIIGTAKKGKLRGQVGSDENTISASTTSGDVNILRY